MAEFIQNGGTNGGQYARHFSCKLTAYEETENVIYYQLELISGSSGRFYGLQASYAIGVNGAIVNNGSGTYESQSYNTSQIIASGRTTIDKSKITPDANGNYSITASATLDFQANTYSPGDFSVGGTVGVSPVVVTKYPAVLRIDSVNTNLDSAIVNYTYISGDFYHLQYSLDNGEWIDTLGNPSTQINNLKPNREYNIRLRGLNQDRTLIGNPSNQYNFKTLEEAKITVDTSEIEFGENLEFNVNNLSGQKMIGKIYLGNTIIKEFEAKNGKNTINFTEEDLEKIYKSYGATNTAELKVQVITADKYINEQPIQVVFKGKKSCIYVDIDGNKNWRKGFLWININGTWKRAIIWIQGGNGTWKKAA